MGQPVENHAANSLRVMSWNIRSGFGSFDLPEEMSRRSLLGTIARVIRESGADVVGLQEVDRFWQRSGGVDQPRWLAEQLGMEWRHAANVMPDGGSPDDTVPQYGVALLSRWPIVDHEHVLLPTPAGWEPRGALLAVLEMPDRGTVTVVNTHLQVDGGQGAAADQRAEGARLVADLARARRLPAVVTGDLNAGPDDDELDAFTARGSGWQDSWTAVHGDQPGVTIPASPIVEADRRIDYIFASDELEVRDASVVMNGSTRIASDHFPVVANLRRCP